jgi:hypothetical protein
VDFGLFVKRFQELCPGVPFQLEIISGFPRSHAYLDPDFWPPYPKARASDFARFIRLAKKGRPIPSANFGAGKASRKAEAEYQMKELEKSIRYCKESLGLGMNS